MKSDVEFLSLHGGPKTAQSTFDDYSAKGLQYTCPVYYYIHSKFSSASSLGGRQCALFVHAAVSSMVSTITWHHAELMQSQVSLGRPLVRSQSAGRRRWRTYGKLSHLALFMYTDSIWWNRLMNVWRACRCDWSVTTPLDWRSVAITFIGFGSQEGWIITYIKTYTTNSKTVSTHQLSDESQSATELNTASLVQSINQIG